MGIGLSVPEMPRELRIGYMDENDSMTDPTALGAVIKSAAEVFGHVFHDYLGLLQYGGRVDGRVAPRSDVDLVVVTSASYSPPRIHTSRVDLNIVSWPAINALHRRLLINEERPWDGLFASVRVIDSRSPDLDLLMRSVSQAFTLRPIVNEEVDGLRFALSRAIDDVAGASDSIELKIIVSQAMDVFLFCWSLLAHHRWSGLRNSWRTFRSEAGPYQDLAVEVIETVDRGIALANLQTLEEWLLLPFGGPWRSGAIYLSSGFRSSQAASRAPVSDYGMSRILAICSQLDAVAELSE